MCLRASLLLFAALGQWLTAQAQTAAPLAYHVVGDDPGPWPGILGSAGFPSGADGAAGIYVVRFGAAGSAKQWLDRAEEGSFVILEGDSSTAQALGFRPTTNQVRVASVQDARRPQLSIVWERSIELPAFEVPPEARVFTRERWSGKPLVAGFRHGAGAVLWVAVSPGRQGYERFPYLLHALADLGLSPPLRSRRLWAFFDSAYRPRVDLEYFAQRWRSAGISALHVAAWHFHEPDRAKDEYLRTLIESCHRHGILVYAWLELPHVSERFWEEHEAWREKTALLQDAHLDWRKLMNLANRECFRAVSDGVRRLVEWFDWDGVNLAELYFESLQGHENPSRFTPMNEDIRREFGLKHGFDPLELFDPSSARHFSRNEAGLRTFLDFRAELSHRIQGEWIAEIESLRRSKPDLDIVLTHVDDRFDTRMRDSIGADAAALVPLLDRHSLTFLIEDPATIWNLGPDRYRKIADQYAELTPRLEKLAIDINIVDRYQDVYPTRQQTGTELFQLVNQASRAFPRVALYFESSILAPDVPWLSSAAAAPDRIEPAGSGLVVESRYGVGIPWDSAAKVDGRLWPVTDGKTLWLSPGAHMIELATESPHARLLDFTGKLTMASSIPNGVEFAYESSARALALLDKRPRRVEIDGVETEPRLLEAATHVTLCLPRGQHLVTVDTE